ncbi:porin [Caballeronia sp. dw_19]|uniref:porin n=1 Tax=Caballeronia sp. dw_19 TaxID=2719791 RepID=UPI001BD45F0E|nr:porin [Caballeronia sp. dw_19]
MKKTTKAISFLAACLSSSLVHAQSSITLYGRIEESVNLQDFSGGKPGSTDGTRTALASDTSIWGMKGSEDLGAGMRAYFKLENGYNATNGALSNATEIWNRESYVGLSSPTYGSIELGRHWAPGVWLSSRTDPFGRAEVGAQITLLQGSNVRGYSMSLPSSVKYITPDFHGLSANFLATIPGGQALSSNQAVAIDYSHGPLYIGFEYDNAAIAGSTVGQTIGATSSKTAALGATYKFQPVELFGYVQRNHVANLPNVLGYLLGVTIPTGPGGEFRASFAHTSNPGASASLFAVGYNYFVSVRTEVYTAVARLNNGSKATFGMWPASQVFGTSAPGQDITGFQVGIRHLF